VTRFRTRIRSPFQRLVRRLRDVHPNRVRPDDAVGDQVGGELRFVTRKGVWCSPHQVVAGDVVEVRIFEDIGDDPPVEQAVTLVPS